MKYSYAIFAIIILMACNLASPVISTITPNPPTLVGFNEILSISPIIRTIDDGTIVLDAQAQVTVTWEGLPDASTAIFTLSNFLADGGVIQIGQGMSATFTVPDIIEGEVSATAQLPDGRTVDALRLRIVTENMILGDCHYLPPALGPGVTLYAEADLNSSSKGTVIYDAEYIVLNFDENGFYQIQQLDTNEFGWVTRNVGENLAGDCSDFE